MREGAGLQHSLLSHSASSYSILREGRAEVLQRENDVFYNPAQARPTAAAAQPQAAPDG